MPINNTELGYKLSRDLDSIIIEKTDIRNITVQLFYQVDSNKFNPVTNILEANNILNIHIPFKDGNYKIRIISTDPSTELFEYKEYLFASFNNLLKSIIRSVEKIITKCYDCTNCKECNEDNLDEESFLISTMLSFYILNKDYYSFFFNTGLGCIQYNILEAINCITLSEFIKGKQEKSDLNKQIISYLYFIFYLGEKSIFTCCTSNVDKEFKIEEILPYISKYIDTKCIESTIVTNPNYYITDSNFIEIK